MARIAGVLVLAAVVAVMFWALVAIHGPVILLAFPIAALIVWAVGAMVYEDWCPFRYM